MRIVVCQTPRLTYVQVLELLQQESANVAIDLALFPEVAMEHPPQLTEQGVLNNDNVGFMMISRWCRDHRIYVVLGSVDERSACGRCFETCVVFNREGDITLRYRKQSMFQPNKAAGDQPGMFETEFGSVGILLGCEAEEEERWTPLLQQKPYLILNPARGAHTADPILARAHPELEVSAWHQSFTGMERIVEGKMRNYACAFVRADAPLNEGGAGSSMLVEPHRSVLAPGWGAAVFHVNTLSPVELESKKLPGWRPLTIDELVKAAISDRALLTHEELKRGPRYHLWSMRPERMMLSKSLQWGQSVKLGRARQHLAEAGPRLIGGALAGAVHQDRVADVFNQTQGVASCKLLRSVRDGARELLVVASTLGDCRIWDLTLKRPKARVTLPRLVPTATGHTRQNTQYILTCSMEGGLGFAVRIYDIDQCLTSVSVRKDRLPWDEMLEQESDWRVKAFGDDPDDIDELSYKARVPVIRAVYPLDLQNVFAVMDVGEAVCVPHGLIINLHNNDTVKAVDIYGEGPPPPLDEDEEDLDELETLTGPDNPRASFGMGGADKLAPANLPVGAKADRIVATAMLEQHFAEIGRSAQILAVLYASNRLMHLTTSDCELHEVVLLDGDVTSRTRKDVPLHFFTLPHPGAEYYHMVVSYASGDIKWWQVSLRACKLQANGPHGNPLVHLAIREWPLQTNEAPQQGLESVLLDKTSLNQRRGSTAASVVGSELAFPISRTTSPRPPTGSAYAVSVVGMTPSARSHGHVAPPPLPATEGAGQRVQHKHSSIVDSPRLTNFASIGASAFRPPPDKTASLARNSMNTVMSRKSVAGAGVDRHNSARRPSGVNLGIKSSLKQRQSKVPALQQGGLTSLFSKDDGASILVAAIENSGALVLYVGRGSRLAKVYSCAEHLLDRTIAVDDMLFTHAGGIVILLSNGDARLVELVFDEDIISITDVPLKL
eukprot:TRINITY_DN27235_c0_g2_i1.p1 TRINITY_DN27235_c0_g2~~TRINITY_DN27235_c0_g2_i1.p1  ORF type:complete len:951 (+),score=160.84 TRINITY_DN27235_c0_g2_i1:144-2996(+)